MMKQVLHPILNPYELDRKTTRLTDYNYASSNYYYVTICTKDRTCIFGEVKDQKMYYSPQGYITDVILINIPLHFPMAEITAYSIMPDHIHILLYINNPEVDQEEFNRRMDINGTPLKDLRKNSIGKNSLSSIIKSFKSAASYHCHRLSLKLDWQSSFYDRVVSNPDEKVNIIRYINDNPKNWEIEQRITNGKWPV